MSKIELKDIYVRYGMYKAVRGLSFTCEDGRLTCILGPSGAGKTSTLKAIAGILTLSDGAIFIDNRDVTMVASQDRELAMTFEGYNLYPHFTVYENLSFPLKSPRRRNSYNEASIDKRVREIATMLEIKPLLDRLPREISGGQKQRVGLGRMLVRENPSAYLLDEPIAHLDAKLRHQMVGEIKRIHKELGKTMLYATPDADEAIALADEIIFLNEGRLVQIGSPEDFILKPANTLVAEFIGDPKINFFNGKMMKKDGDFIFKSRQCSILIRQDDFSLLQRKYAFEENQNITLAIRPQYCSYSYEKPEYNYLDTPLCVCLEELRGDSVVLSLGLEDERYLVKVKEIDNRLKIGDNIWLTFNPHHVHIFNEAGQNLIR
ncbi:MAG: ABC transporter ATP-binding protein [Candidatus Marinimicrobia bacterium]|nr:ABC transporter ATP-binding protein [Candidatus Neomarinimicrobiota bacterium]